MLQHPPIRRVTAPCLRKPLPMPHQSPATNQLIDGLPASDAASLLAECHSVDLEFDHELNDSSAPISRVLFPTTVIISVTAKVSDHGPLEMGMIGYEGMLGASLALGIERHPMRAVVQGDGIALEMTSTSFKRHLEDSPALKQAIHGYLFVCAEQLAQTATCNAFHEVAARLARWLLMMDDRARGQPLTLTHLFLADMLGVRRSAVTIAAGQMQDKKMISYSRGHIQVLSRSGLESVACECYPAAITSYERQFGSDQGT
ncbi:Crp/Fnr family transcriptional regulator [Wenzhouxiangella sp. EGI_FJ10409]|uniref:Crp/Fnr family transcriptional regulator n=1 Tax=Wenzhouxiangella sp. EGI_FJ10409 TaxID=3243767 RepID=UPI0035DC1B1C